jgi:hypothetical protein
LLPFPSEHFFCLLKKNVNVKTVKNIILPVVLYGYETWSLMLRVGLRLKVFQKRVLRRIFGTKKDEIKRGWRKLHNEELHNLRSSPNINRMLKSRWIKWIGHIARMRRRVMHTGFGGGGQEGKKPLETSGHK